MLHACSHHVEELHRIAACAQLLRCARAAHAHRLGRALVVWRAASVRLVDADAHARLDAECASLASRLANAKVRLAQLSHN